MTRRAAFMAPTMVVALAACDASPERRQDEPAAAIPSTSTSAPAAPQATAVAPAPASSTSTKPAGGEEQAAAQVLEAFARAITKGDWQGAASMWSADAGVTPQSLRDLFGGRPPQMLVVGKGEVEGAAGSLYYSTSLSFDSHDGPRRFTVTLRRVNDVPGATAAQLRWHLETMEQP